MINVCVSLGLELGLKSIKRRPLLMCWLYRVEQLDHSTNMPPVMDEALWALMCKLRRAKIENEIRVLKKLKFWIILENLQFE